MWFFRRYVAGLDKPFNFGRLSPRQRIAVMEPAKIHRKTLRQLKSAPAIRR